MTDARTMAGRFGMSDRARLVVAGAGLFGSEHLRMLAAWPDVAVVGVADANAEAAEAAASRFGVAETATDAIELTERLRPDGLIVATPGPTHVAIAGHALGLGIPVLVEKPVAMSVADAAKLAAMAEASDGFVLPGHVLRFSEPHRRFAGIVRSAAVGTILSVTARRHRDDSHARRYTEDPVLMTMVHDIDLALWLTGGEAMPRKVLATRRPAGTSRSETLATVTGATGAVWRLATAWTFPIESCPSDRIEVVGENGSAELDVDGTIRVFGTEPQTIEVTIDYDAALHAEHMHFVDCLRSGKPPETVTLREAITGLAVAEAAMASIGNGDVVITAG
ncbi:MAG: Gfo/Idh/MocA family oxidoreductase [Bauldia sp.]|uniref:Gfo/Idh/MocA family protein n=1 Tax=Bauldia sp. TaxID=2575872 RepID=UPI001D430D04|nr:Gfo/Idh/MocA family oxidoreductase [Bauldia sp.]MCB1495860.1 Gfo/Idh/MocA family oxidoreductase [Bauldia sp.]